MAEGRINHVGIATVSLDDSEEFWAKLGFLASNDMVNEEQGVRIRYLSGRGGTRIELLEPLSEDSPVGRFISSRGQGVQQLAVDVADLDKTISVLKSAGVKMVSEKPVIGSDGHRIAFVHPSSTGGVLIELVESSK